MNNVDTHSRPRTHASQIFFLHAPKTAGTTFTAVLDRQFSKEEICPAYYWRELLKIPRRDLQRYRLVRGHFDYTVTELLVNPQVITMLREPVARTISHHRYMCSLARHPLREVYSALSLAEVVQHPELGRNMRDPQVTIFGRITDLEEMRRRIAQDSPPLYPWEDRPRHRPPTIERAKRRVASAAFVGLQERFEDSLLLLADTFGWIPPETIEPLNITPEEATAGGVDDGCIATVKQANRLDIELYRFAHDLFDERFRDLLKRTAAFLGSRVDEVGRNDIASFVGSKGERVDG